MNLTTPLTVSRLTFVTVKKTAKMALMKVTSMLVQNLRSDVPWDNGYAQVFLKDVSI